jgi:ElaB/YqjD/DUF883 family membrane-anchored ribosome-binding protein
MDQQREAAVSDAATKVGDTLSDLTAKSDKSEKIAQDKIDQAKPVLRDLRETAGAAIDKATDRAQRASTAGAQAVDAVQGAARDVGSQASRAASAVYQQGARAGESVSRYTTEQPLTALLIVAAIGYGIAYLIHRS